MRHPFSDLPKLVEAFTKLHDMGYRAPMKADFVVMDKDASRECVEEITKALQRKLVRKEAMQVAATKMQVNYYLTNRGRAYMDEVEAKQCRETA